MALGSLWSNKFRSGLTILGVMVGVGSVIGMASIINGFESAAKSEVDSQGSNIITVSKFAPDVDHSKLTQDERNRPWITVGEAKAILANCPTVDGVSPRNYYFKRGGNEARYKNRKFNRPRFMGTWPDYLRVFEPDISQGRFISQTDEQFRLMNCVIGYDIANVLFEGSEDPIGREIRVNQHKFTVIGVTDEVKSNFGNDFRNKLIMIPLSTYQKLIPWEKELALDVRASSYEEIDKAKEEVINALRIYRKVPFNKPNNFGLATQDSFKETISQIMDIIYIVSMVITSVGLMVGGIGVMNIMLVSVTERTREIGVRKAIGAKRSNIILQFLTEAMTLSGVGGIVGVFGGLALGFAGNMALGFPLAIPIFWILVGFFVSVSVGLISGIYPAIKAAYLDPIEALRYE